MTCNRTQCAWRSGKRALMDRAAEDDLISCATRILEQRVIQGEPLTDPNAAMDFLRMRLSSLDLEVFFLMFLDTRHRVIATEVAFMGTIDSAEVHPRVVAQMALKHNAAAIICAHNHPSHNPEPSAADRAVTAQLKQALSLLDVRLLDHFVVTAKGCTSMAARGWI